MQFNVYEWLVNTANKYPNKEAVCDSDGSYTFYDLLKYSMYIGTRISNILDGQIKKAIAIYGENSKEEIVAFLSVIFSGNFYVPIDKEMPLFRLRNIFKTLDPSLVICIKDENSDFAEEFPGIKVMEMSRYLQELSEFSEMSYDYLTKAPFRRLTSEDLLYIIFTSGSTGIPKGVAIPHRGVINYISWVEECFQINCNEVIGSQAPFYFDNSVLDIYSMIKSGATLCITPRLFFSQPVPLLRYIKEKKISLIFWVPSALILIARARALKNVNLDGILKKILFAGEVMPAKQLNYWREYLPNAIYANLYGPTEITVDCTYYILDREFENDDSIPIGKSIANVEVFVLDENNKQIKEADKIGELCVKGVGLAVGYYNNPEKTSEVFVQNPLNSMYSDKIYRTGDLVKYNSQGELVYVSRKDYQIKHMGHRIELGEIETAASSLDSVNNCCCIYDEKRKKIVLFIEGKDENDEIVKQLRQKLPKYMIPNEIKNVKEFMYTQNGKIDKAKMKETL